MKASTAGLEVGFSKVGGDEAWFYLSRRGSDWVIRVGGGAEIRACFGLRPLSGLQIEQIKTLGKKWLFFSPLHNLPQLN